MFRIICIALLLAAPLAAEDWQPKETWVFAVGVLEYEHHSGWPEDDDVRTDGKMIQAYKDRGVPERQGRLLEKQGGHKKGNRRRSGRVRRQTGQG